MINKQLLEQIDDFFWNLRMNNLSQNTIKSYRNDIDNFLMFLEKEDLNVSQKTFKKYFTFLYEKELSAATIKRKVNVLRQIFKDEVPDIHIKGSKRLPNVFSDEELMRIRKNLARGRDQMIFDIMINTGIRIDELHKLNRNDLYRFTLTIHGKGSKDRKVFLPKELANKLREYFDGTLNPLIVGRTGRRLSVNFIRKILQRAAERAELDKHFTPHHLRHSFATRLLKNDVNIYALSKLMGHAKIETTANYLKIVDKELEKEFHEKWRVL